MRGVVGSKRGDADWSVSVVVKFILIVIVLALILYGVVSKQLNPLLENMGGKIDGVLIAIGLKSDGGSGNVGSGINCREESIRLGEYPSPLTYKECYTRNSARCDMFGFTDLSHYTYDPVSDTLHVERPGKGGYTVDSDAQVGDTGLDYDSGLYLGAMKFLYEDIFNGEVTNPTKEYNIDLYLSLGMDEYFGEMGDMTILHDEATSNSGETTSGVLIEQNGRFVVFNYYNYLQYREAPSLSTLTPQSVTNYVNQPWLNGARAYHGNNRAEALAVFYRMTDGIYDNDIHYTVCKTKSLISPIDNCLSQSLENGGDDYISTLLFKEAIRQEDSSTSIDRELDSDEELSLLSDHFVYTHNEYVNKGVVVENVTQKINSKLNDRNTFFTNVDTYSVRSTESPNLNYYSDSPNLPTLELKGESSDEVFYMRFVGAEAYESGEGAFFVPDAGLNIRPPFALFDSQGNLLPFDLNFFISDSDKEIDAEVLRYMRGSCVFS